MRNLRFHQESFVIMPAWLNYEEFIFPNTKTNQYGHEQEEF